MLPSIVFVGIMKAFTHLVGHIGFNVFSLLLLVLYKIRNLIVCSYNNPTS